MLNKFIVFIVMFLLFISGGTRVDTTVFSSMPYDSGSSFPELPVMKFLSWRGWYRRCG